MLSCGCKSKCLCSKVTVILFKYLMKLHLNTSKVGCLFRQSAVSMCVQTPGRLTSSLLPICRFQSDRKALSSCWKKGAAVLERHPGVFLRSSAAWVLWTSVAQQKYWSVCDRWKKWTDKPSLRYRGTGMWAQGKQFLVLVYCWCRLTK